MLITHVVATLLFIHFVVHSVTASASVDNFRCSETCTGEFAVANLGVLRSHQYDFKIKHVISSPVEKDFERSLMISGKAVISGGVNCTYELLLEEVKVMESEFRDDSDENMKLAKVLEENRAFFGFDDGTVTGFCPSKKEKPFAWNIKAAVLSHLQSELKSGSLPSETVEDDISGKCLARFDIIEKTEKGLTFVKRKPTAGCGEKYNLLSRYNGILDTTPSAGSKQGMVEGEQECHVSLTFNKPLSSASCEEYFVIRQPLGGLWKEVNQIRVSTSLKLLSSDSSGSLDIDEPENYLQSQLRYHESFMTCNSDQRSTTEESTEELPEIKNAQFFDSFVRSIQRKENLDSLKDLAKSEEDMKFLIDAAVHARTEASMDFLGWCLENSRFPFPVGQMSMISRPSLKYIQAAKKALTKTDSKSYKMVMSNLLKSYCDYTPKCTAEESVIELIQTLEKPIMNGCEYSTSEEFDQILDSLRAIGNLGKVSDRSVVYPALKNCLTPSSNRNLYVLVSAAEAFLRFSEDDEADDILLEVISDFTQNTEVRIQAFRSYVRHLTKTKFFRIEQMLMKDDQLESYVWSYFNEMVNSQDLSKQDEILMLQNLYSPRRSSNFLSSFYMEKFFNIKGYGGGVASSVIYGPQSSIPRSVDLNYTVNLLGYSVNILQLKYRSLKSRGVQRFFERAELVDKDDSVYDRSRLAVRMFDRDMSFLDNVDNSSELAYLASTRNYFIAANETFTLPTIGGILIEIGDLLLIHQKASFANGEKDIYGFDIYLDAVRKLKVSLNMHDREFGFSTEDKMDMRVPFVIAALFQPGDVSIGILGTDSSFTAFKQSRSLFSISSNGAWKEIPFKTLDTPRKNFPPILSDIFGFEAYGSFSYIDSTYLVTEIKIELERFEGLVIKFSKSENDASTLHYIKSINFQIQRYVLNDTQDLFSPLVLTNDVFGVQYKYRQVSKEWSTAVKCECLQKSYDLSINSSGDGELEGVMHLGNWTAKISGNLQQVGASDYEISAQIVHPHYSVSLNQQTTLGKRYALAAESTSTLLPFIFKTATNYGTRKELYHQSELQLPTWKKSVHLETQLSWNPQNALAMLSLEVKKGDSSQKWKGEIVAMNNIGKYRDMTLPLAYNYSL